MTRTDTFVVGTLVLLLALVAGLIGVPALQLSTASSTASDAPAGRERAGGEARPYVEGALGAPVSVTPLTARTQVDRDLVALALLGSRAQRARRRRSCPTWPSAGRSTRPGRRWTVDLRDDARWHDGEPVTADDVLFTIRDPAGPGLHRARRRRRGAR